MNSTLRTNNEWGSSEEKGVIKREGLAGLGVREVDELVAVLGDSEQSKETARVRVSNLEETRSHLSRVK